MAKLNVPNRRRLFRLLDKIIGEERNFKRHSRDAAVSNQLSNPVNHEQREHDPGGRVEDFRAAQEELLRIHRRFINEHELLIQRCLNISRQARAGMLNENEVAMEIERLQQDLGRIKREHGQVEKECQEIFRNHGRMVGQGGGKD